MEGEAKSFESWALVEIYGHQKFAGKVTEQQIGGCNFVRVDIPETSQAKGFTKLFGQGAIFSITPIREDVARHLAEKHTNPPVSEWDLPPDVRKALNAIELQASPRVVSEDRDVLDFEQDQQSHRLGFRCG